MEIKAALTNLAAATPSRNAGTRISTLPTNQRKTEKRILILQASVKNKWKVGWFCSTHNHGVRSGHSSNNCNDKKNFQVNTATYAGPAGPGKDINKGWDDWLM